jgi:hypothetical protein
MSNALKQYHPVKTAVAILLMLLFLICLGLLVWASNRGATINGPVHIAANSASVYVTLNDEILVLDTHGVLQERHALKALGIAAYPIDLRLQDDGTLLVATQRPAGLLICESIGWRCRALESPLFKQLRRQIKVQPDADREGLFVSDTAGGGLHWLSADGQTTRALSTAKGFQRINDIALDDKQRLWVADSGNRRLVILQADANGDWGMTGELSARTELARPGLDWPMMIAFSPTGNAWVVQPDPTLERADLLIYDAKLGAKGRIKLPEDMHPTDVARSGNGMLVTDRDAFRIMRVDINTHAVTPFGDHRVQAILGAAFREKANANRMLKPAIAGMVVFGVLMIAMAFWASPKGRRFSPRPKVPMLEPRPWPESRNGGLHWLVRDTKTEKFLRMAQWALLVTTVGMLGALAYAWYLLNTLLDDEAVQQAAACVTGISEMFAVLGLFVLGAPVLGYLGFRHMRNRLGSDSHYLHVQLYNGRHLTLDPARLVYRDRMLAYENHLFPIQTGNRKPVYAEGEIETHIAPLLSRATRLGIFAMLRYQFRHREPTTIASALYIVTFAAVFWYMGLWRFMFPGK